jgi:dienelactone hydrolase
MGRNAIVWMWVLGACSPPPEPLNLPEDPAETGVPVGVRTIEASGLTLEVWYPAAEVHRGEPGSPIQVENFVPPAVQEALGDVELPSLSSIAVRDAAVRVPALPYPVVLFSHGFGGMRVQSNDITTHLASRGYVVAATDHIGRSMVDLLPCIFSPALEGCNLSGMGGEDPGPEDMATIVDWLEAANANEEDPLYGVMNLEALGVTGHSAGGGSTAALVDTDPRFKAAIPMAGTGAISREVPVMVMAGTCDSIVEAEALESAWSNMPLAGLARFRGAGHLAFSNICDLDMGTFAETHLLPREDVNSFFLESLVDLGTDGCPGEEREEPFSEDCAAGYQDLAVSQRGIRHLVTRFFDEALTDGNPFELETTDPAIEWVTK